MFDHDWSVHCAVRNGPLCLLYYQGIKIVERVEIPPELVPKDAKVEITAKVYGGYHGGHGYKGVSTLPSPSLASILLQTVAPTELL